MITNLTAIARKNAYAATAAGLFVALLILAVARGPKLFTAEGVEIAFAVAAPLVLAAMAVTPVAISGRGGVDLSVGPLLALVNVAVAVWLLGNDVTSPFLVVPFAIVLGGAVGMFQGLIVAVLRLQPIVVTLGGYLILSGLALIIEPQPSKTSVPEWLTSLTGSWAGIPAAAVVLAGILLLWLPIGRSTFFRNVRMLGFSERTAYANGVALIRTRVGAYALGGVLAGLAGLMATSLLASADPNQGAHYTLVAVTALVLGGTSIAGGSGGMTGSVIAALDVYLIQYVLATFNFGKQAAFVGQLSNGAVLIIALLLGAFAITYLERRRLA